MSRQLLSFLLTTIILIVGCKPNDDQTPTPQKNCKLTNSQSITLYPDGSADTITSHYDYDKQGSMIRVRQVSSSGTGTDGIYTYNSKGLLTEVKNTTNGNYASVSTVTYMYLQDRLSRAYTVYQSATEQYTSDNNYDTQGQLTYSVWQGKYFSNGATTLTYKDSTLNLYTDRRLTQIIEYRQRDQFINTNRYTVQTDAKGHVLSTSKEDGNKASFQYNVDGELIRQNSFYNEKLIAYTVYEYDAKKDILSLISPVPYAHIANLYGKSVHNVLKNTYYSDTNPTQTLQESSSTLYEYEYNDQGYPTKRIRKYTYNGQTILTTTTYNITCQ